MSDSRREWEEVTETFSGLGQRLREHYERQRSAEAPEGKPEVEQALRTLGDALDRAFSSVGEALRDPEFRRGAGQAVNALGDALAATVNETGEELRKRMGRMPPPGRPADPDPAAGDSSPTDDPPTSAAT